MKQFSLFRAQATELSSLPYKRLRDAEWDFREIPASSGVYGIHPYPAMFHFLVVRQLLHRFSAPTNWIFDPFMGSGVTAVESFIHHRNFIGFDINPLALLIAKVRTTPLSRQQLSATLQQLCTDFPSTLPESVSFPNIHYWFHETTIVDLSRLRKLIRTLENTPLRNFFLVAFTETVRRVSRTKYNEFKLLRKSKEENPNVIETFRAVALRNIDRLTNFYARYPTTPVEQIFKEHNILRAPLPAENSIDLILTSPPYGDSRTTVAYGQFSRLPLQWLGLEETVDKSSLGCKAQSITPGLPSSLLYETLEKVASKDEKRAKEVFAFYADLYTAIERIAPTVRPDGYVCWVVGNRRVKGEEMPTDKISADFFEALGFVHCQTYVRAISNKRMPAANSPSNVRGAKEVTMRYEYIVILQKAGTL